MWLSCGAWLLGQPCAACVHGYSVVTRAGSNENKSACRLNPDMPNNKWKRRKMRSIRCPFWLKDFRLESLARSETKTSTRAHLHIHPYGLLMTRARSLKGKLQQSAKKAEKEGKRIVTNFLKQATNNNVTERPTPITSAQLARGSGWVANQHSEWSSTWNELTADIIITDKPNVGSDRTLGCCCP